MLPEAQAHRFPLWLRWLGWTGLFILICLATSLADAVFRQTTMPLPYWFSLASPLIAAVLIGTRFRSWWWALAPPAPVLALLVSVGLRDPDASLVLGWLLIPIVFMCFTYSVPALIGVWWGIQRAENDFEPARCLGIDPSLWLLGLLLVILVGLPLLGVGLVSHQFRTNALPGQQSASASISRFRCQTVPPDVVDHLETGLDIPFSSLRGARFVNAKLDINTWIIAADVQGWGYWGNADVALWTITSDYAKGSPTLRTSDPISSLNPLAAQHSVFPFNAHNPGSIDEAIACMHSAPWSL